MPIADVIMRIIETTKPATAPVTETAHLYTDLGFDSLAFVQLLIHLEEIFAISIDLMEMDTCLQVNRLMALVEKKVKESGHDSTFAAATAKSPANGAD